MSAPDINHKALAFEALKIITYTWAIIATVMLFVAAHNCEYYASEVAFLKKKCGVKCFDPSRVK